MKLPPFIVIDLETTGLNHVVDDIHGAAIAWKLPEHSELQTHYVPRHKLHTLKYMLGNAQVVKINHHLKFDVRMLEANGLPVRGPKHDTLQMARLIDENMPAGLKDLARKYLGSDALSDETAMRECCKVNGAAHIGELCAMDLADPSRPFADIIAAYAIEDVVNTYKLFMIFKEELRRLDKNARRTFASDKGPLDYYLHEAMPAEDALMALEKNGVGLRVDVLEEYRRQLLTEQRGLVAHLNSVARGPIARVRKALVMKARKKVKSEKGRRSPKRYKEAQFNWQSADHLGRLLYDAYGLPARRTVKGGWATDEQTLKVLASTLGEKHKARAVLAGYARLQKIKKELGTYVDGWLERATEAPSQRSSVTRLYSSFHQNTDTGRTGSRNPNLQNVPRSSPVKRAIVPTPGNVFLYADYSQVELRIAAHCSRDENMMAVFEQGLDPHIETAAAAFNVPVASVTKDMRQAGKTLNFLLIYKGGPMRLQEELAKNGIEVTRERAKEFIERYFARYEQYKKFLAKTWEAAKRTSTVMADNGRVRRLPDVVYDGHINRRRRSWHGPAALEKKLWKPGDPMRLENEELFDRAIRRAIHAEKQAYNFPIQSMGATITKAAMTQLLAAGFTIRLMIHDSIICEVPKAQAEAKLVEMTQIMENAYQLSVPLKVDGKILNSLDEGDIFVP